MSEYDREYEALTRAAIVVFTNSLKIGLQEQDEEIRTLKTKITEVRAGVNIRTAKEIMNLHEKNNGLGNKVVALEAEIAILKSPKKPKRKPKKTKGVS